MQRPQCGDTGCIPSPGGSVLADGQLETSILEFHEETMVKFSELSEELLWEYIDSGEPM